MRLALAPSTQDLIEFGLMHGGMSPRAMRLRERPQSPEALRLLRRRHTGEGDGAFSMLGYPLLPIFYIGCLLGVAARVFFLEPRLALAGIVILLTGWPLFRLGHTLFGGRTDR